MSRLLAIAATLEPPFVLLESGGHGAEMLAWGASEKCEIPNYRTTEIPERLEGFEPGAGWIGAIAYEFGLPDHVPMGEPMIEQPLVALFKPRNRITIHADGSVETFGPDASRAIAAPHPASPVVSIPRSPGPSVSRLSFDQPAFEAAVRKALDYIGQGDVYQVNLSVAERVNVHEPAFDSYRRLREINPSPWMGYADFGDWQLVCGSPELLVEVKDGVARARPIAGTRRRTGDPAADDAMRRELLSDRKEAAEHVMLVDLARNDLGMVCGYGSVAVETLGRVEEYSHVMHLVSDVTGRLAPGRKPFDAFRAMFPGGTITGCPKIRAMEIIAELEPVARGMYTGALGWWREGNGGNEGQWNIVIRSAVVRGGEAVIQAGAGIVADSDPTREWKESRRKAEALREAFGVANSNG